ncbi:MAG: hypothetical protein AAGA43_01360 [Bacteroidota bacterium]
MTKYLIVVLLHIAFVNRHYSNDCKTITKFDEYNMSEIIFLGYVTEKDSEHFTITIIEIFKGKDFSFGSKVQGFLGLGVVNPNIGETWLLYGSFSENGIVINRCGHSRSFSNPYSLASNDIPPPLAIESSKEAQDLIENVYLNRALAELQYDVMDLRQRKFQAEYTRLYDKNSDESSYLVWILISFSLFFSSLSLFVVLKKK